MTGPEGLDALPGDGAIAELPARGLMQMMPRIAGRPTRAARGGRIVSPWGSPQLRPPRSWRPGRRRQGGSRSCSSKQV
jgi:hypothetical protein